MPVKKPRSQKKVRKAKRKLGTRKYTVVQLPSGIRTAAINIATFLSIYQLSASERKKALSVSRTEKARVLRWALRRGIYDEVIKERDKLLELPLKERYRTIVKRIRDSVDALSPRERRALSPHLHRLSYQNRQTLGYIALASTTPGWRRKLKLD